MKDLHHGRIYWPETLEERPVYPELKTDLKVRTAIIGGGMSGVICGYMMAKQGIRACILERGEIAGGSTSSNAGLLQYCSDIMLTDLTEQIGSQAAVRFYRACRDAIKQLGRIASELPVNSGFMNKSSLYYASTEQDLPKLRQEYEALKAAGFEADYWGPEQIASAFPFRKPGAIITHGDAEVNPIRFVVAMAQAASRFGLDIREHCSIISHESSFDGKHLLRTADGYTIEAEQVVYAIGYEPEELRGKLIKASLNRSYAVVTAPQRGHVIAQWHKRWFIWETARPYFYMRLAPDGRVIAGGLDQTTGQLFAGKQAISHFSDKLLERIQQHFPAFDAPVEYEWNATFGESRDNLPFIGEDPKQPGVYYSLGYGGNGTVYSAIAAELLSCLVQGKTHPIADTVSLTRPTLQRS